MFKIEKKDNFFRVRIEGKWFSSYRISTIVDSLKRFYKIPSTLIITP